jgi:hypothetical protein
MNLRKVICVKHVLTLTHAAAIAIISQAFAAGGNDEFTEMLVAGLKVLLLYTEKQSYLGH